MSIRNNSTVYVRLSENKLHGLHFVVVKRYVTKQTLEWLLLFTSFIKLSEDTDLSVSNFMWSCKEKNKCNNKLVPFQENFRLFYLDSFILDWLC